MTITIPTFIRLMATLGQRAAAALRSAKKAAIECGRQMAWSEVAAIIDGTAQQIREERAIKRSTPRASRARNDMLDAFVLACGSNPEEVTPSALRAAAVALAEIKAACHDVTTDDLRRRAIEYKRKHPTWPLTPSALAKHWAALGGGAATASSKRDIYVEPNNWRGIAASVLGIAPEVLDDRQWLDLGPDTRAQVLRNLN